MEVPFVDLHAQYLGIKDKIDTAIANVIKDSSYIKGPYVQKFEEQFAEYLGVKECVGCANGTDALEIALKALNVGPGDEVIVPANTWISTAEAVTTAGASVVFVDSEPNSYTMNTSLLKTKVTPKTKAIIPVHLYGHPAEMDEILAFAKAHNLKVIEDCAQAHGATYKGRKVGTMGDIGCFSFFPGKNLGAYGDAGGMTTNDVSLATYCRMLANHGRLGKFDHEVEGRNSRLDGLQAAILSAKLPFLEEWTENRISNSKVYDELLKGAGVLAPSYPDYVRHVFHLYVVQVSERERVQTELGAQGIHTGIHYPIPLPFLKAYKRLGHSREEFPVAASQMDRIISLPMFAELDKKQIEHVVSSLLSSLSGLEAVSA